MTTFIYDISEDTKIREIARLREKALHDEASALKNAKEEGRVEERAIAEEREKNAIQNLKALGLTDEQIKAAFSGNRL